MATKKTTKAPANKRAARTVKREPGSKVYKCGSCGMVTTEKGHLCDPQEIKKVYTCEYCGVAVSDPRHVCKPKVSKMSYVCDACGRVAVDKDHLCEPMKIRG